MPNLLEFSHFKWVNSSGILEIIAPLAPLSWMQDPVSRTQAFLTILTPETVRRLVENAMPIKVIGLPEGRKRSV